MIKNIPLKISKMNKISTFKTFNPQQRIRGRSLTTSATSREKDKIIRNSFVFSTLTTPHPLDVVSEQLLSKIYNSLTVSSIILTNPAQVSVKRNQFHMNFVFVTNT